jgi:hypothetical protein
MYCKKIWGQLEDYQCDDGGWHGYRSKYDGCIAFTLSSSMLVQGIVFYMCSIGVSFLLLLHDGKQPSTLPHPTQTNPCLRLALSSVNLLAERMCWAPCSQSARWSPRWRSGGLQAMCATLPCLPQSGWA